MNTANRDLSYLKPFTEENPEKYLSRGVRVPRFRKNRKQVKNRVLYAILLSRDIKLSELAAAIGVSGRAVNAWVVDGVIPKEKTIAALCRYLGYPYHILFNEGILRNSPIICVPEQSKYYKRVTAISAAKNEILHGLMALYDISLSDVAKWNDLNPGTLSKYIHNIFLPADEYRRKLSVFFRMPEGILFYNVFSEKQETRRGNVV